MTTAWTKATWYEHAWRIALLWGLLLAAYSNSFKAGLIFDNDPAILQDSRVHAVTAENVGRILREGFWAQQPYSGQYRPVATFSFLLNYAVLGNGPNPTGYHWVNLILHALNAALVYALALIILGAPTLAFPTAALWALHPLFTESVTNVIQRVDLLGAFFVLAGFLCHVTACTSGGRFRRPLALAGLFTCQALGLFSKESAAVLPALMLVYDVTWPDRATWRARAASYGALVLPFAAFFFMRYAVHTNLQVLPTDNPLVGADFLTARLTAIKVVGKLLWLLIWPAQLSVDYSFDSIPLFGWSLTNWEDVQTIVALVICLGCIALLVHWYRSRKPLFFLMALAIIAFSPTSNMVILIGTIMAERFAYLPAVGLAGCAVVGIHALGQRIFLKSSVAAWATPIVIAVIAVGFGARTYARNFDWYDAGALWRSAVEANPANAKAHLNLGNVLMRSGDLTAAVGEYKTALAIDPNYPSAHNNLGAALMRMPGRLLEAIGEYETALRLNPRDVDAHNNLGTALSQLEGRQEDAIAHFRAALQLFPDSLAAHSNLGGVLLQFPDRLHEAIAEFEAALKIDPQFTDARWGLATALAQTPDGLHRAIVEFETLLRATPNDAGAHHNLGNALAQIPGRMPDAVAQWRMALQIDPSLAQSHYNLGMALAQLPEHRGEAIRELEIAHQLTGDARIRQVLDRLNAGSN